MATIGEMIVKLIADTGNFNTDMAEAATTVKASQDAMASSMQTSMQAFRNFENITKESVQSAEGLAQAQAALTAVQNSGAFTAEELAAKQALVSAALKKVQADADASAFSIAKITNNSRTMYTVSALATDVMTGQFSRSRREVAALANETGLFGGALRMLLGPAGLVAVAIAGIGAAAIEANKDFEDLQRSLVESGNFAGMTADQMATMAQRIANGGGDITTAAEAIKALAASGQVSHAAMENASRGVADFAFVTKDKIGEAVNTMVELGKDPVKASAKLNESLNYLTSAQFDQINSLAKQGKQTQAADLAQAVFANAMHTRAEQMAGYASTVEKAWQQAWNTVSGHGEVQQAEAAHTMQTRIAAIKEELDFLAAHGNREKNTLAPGGVSQDPVSEAYVAQLKQEKANLEAELALVNGAAQKMGDAAAKVRDHIQQAMHPGGKTGAPSTTATDEEAFQQAQYAAQQQGQEMSLAAQKAWWQQRLDTDKAGGAADANAAAAALRHVVEIQKQLDNQSAQSGREAARKRADALKQADKEIEQEAEQEAQAQHDADEQSVDDAHTLATAKINAALQADKTLRAEGQITARQLYEDQIAALNQQLTADIQYYQQKAKLDADDAAAAMKWQSAILVDVEKTNAEMLRAQQAYADAVKRINKDTADEKIRDDQRMIMSGFREINQLIGHQETFKQALANIGMEILETQEQNVAKGIAEAFNGEQAKTAAASAGAAERLGITVASEAQALLVQGEAAVKWIITEAAKAAAGAFNAMVSIPYVGPFLAVGASVAAFAAVAKLVGSVSSAAGGWERVPADGMMTELHRDEMVLPAHFANPMRDMVKNGGGMGGVHHHHYNIQAYDRRGLADFVSRHGAELGNGVRRLGRNGHRL